MQHKDSAMTPREQLLSIFQAGVAAVSPEQAVTAHLELRGSTLWAHDVSYPLDRGRVLVLGAGKGAAPMTAAVEKLLGARICRGLAVVKYGHTLPLRHVELAEAAHPVPDAAGEEATRRMLALAREARAEDLVICCITGGASALTPAPVDGVTLEDLRMLTEQLLACGASIHEINALRKHLSLFSGGNLARAAAPARVLALVVSDVVGDDLDVIASGPVSPDASTFALCRDIVHKYGLERSASAPVLAHLDAGCQGRRPETPKPGDAVFERVHTVLAATNRQALDAAAREAQALGYAPRIVTDAMTGDAAETARHLVAEARRAPAGACLLAGGECTVNVIGTGLGGRNQHMALAAALELEGEERLAALFAGTDGTDGPTDAAGGYALPQTAARIRCHADPLALLHDNDSHHALHLAGDLLTTGPTLTNVMDMAVLLVKE